MMSTTEPLRFSLPPDSEADAPPETRGVARDGVRLLTATPRGIDHRVFRDLPEVLTPGDLVVVNTSATLPAALVVTRGDGRAGLVHVSGALDDGDWVVEVRRADNTGPATDVTSAERMRLPGRIGLRIDSVYPDPAASHSRLWRARPTPSGCW